MAVFKAMIYECCVPPEPPSHSGFQPHRQNSFHELLEGQLISAAGSHSLWQMDRQTFTQTQNLSIDAKTVTLLLLTIASSHKSRTGEGTEDTEWVGKKK